jgi:hypothetical protein
MAFLRTVIERAEPPEARLKKRPPKRIETARRRARVEFRFVSDDLEASFECRLDGARFKPCISPRTVRVRAGRHRFRVRAVAAGGRPGPVVVHRFAVRRR